MDILIGLLIYVLIVFVIAWVIQYGVGLLPIDGRIKNFAVIVIWVIAALMILRSALSALTAITPIP